MPLRPESTRLNAPVNLQAAARGSVICLRAFSCAPHSFGEQLKLRRTGLRLRWKLLIVVPMLAALIGAGACAAAARLLSNSGGGALPVWAAVVALVAPIACVVYASIFVYRHTARRRTLQAAATALLASLLTLTALLLGSLLSGRRTPEQLQPSPPNARRS
jgi:hypothetical protein